MIRFLIFLLSILLFQNLAAQQKEFIFKNFTQEEGLPSNETYYVFEDSRHYIWIATDLGVVRYNGSKFEVFNLPDNVIFKIKEDAKGRIWFFTHTAQLAYFENEKIHLYKYNKNISQRIKRINIVDVYVDEKDNIGLSQSHDSTFTIDSSGYITSSYNLKYRDFDFSEFNIDILNNGKAFTQGSATGSGNQRSITLTLHKKNILLKYNIPFQYSVFSHYGSVLSPDQKFVYFFGGKLLIKLFENGTYIKKEMPEHILCIRPENNGNILVGMMKNGATVLTENFSEKTSDKILVDKSVSSIEKDYEGGTYFSTLENGVYYLKNSLITNITIDKNNFENKNISRLLNVSDSKIIYANSKGIYILQDTPKVIANLSNYSINDLAVDSRKNLYFFGAFNDFTLKITPSTSKDFTKYYCLKTPSEVIFLNQDNIVTSTPTSVLVYKSDFLKYPHENIIEEKEYGNKTIINKPMKLFKDLANNIWGGANDGLYKSSPYFDTMFRFLPSSELLKKGVNNIRQLDSGLLVTAIRFSGIALIENNSVYSNITEANGLLSDKIRFLLPLKNDLWIATAKGISVIRFSSFHPLKYNIVNIGKNDGFYNLTINHLIKFRDNIVAATSNGVYYIEKYEELLNRKLPLIPFYINNINYYKGDTSGLKEITLPYEKSRVLIRYNAVCFNTPDEVKYLYRFQISDTNWHTTTNNELLLENLEPGSYNLQIKAVVPNQNRSSEIQVFTIVVNKPWWQNNWFRLFVFLEVAAGVYFYVSSRIKKIKTREKTKTDLNARMMELEQTALRSQMNPHFIFNCLTSIQQLIVAGNKTDANEYLVKFARLIRKTLDLSASPFISIREEIDYLDEYIFLEQLRLSGQFDYQITSDPIINIDRIRIPNMMVQPVVENCIRHGIKSLEDRKGLITIKFEMGANSITCIVADNGVGRKNTSLFNKNVFTSHKSYGIDIIEKRLKTFAEYNQADMGVEVNDLYNEDGSAAGTQVIMQLPYKINS